MIRPRTDRARPAFTLIELLIVIAILLTIGGLVVVNLLPAKEQADVNLTKVQLDNFGEAMDRFRLDMKRFPSEDEGLAALWSRDAIEDEDEAQHWQGPYLKDPRPHDEWDNEWVYHYPGVIRGEQFYDIISPGPDREEGTEDDINNHHRFVNAEGEIDEAFDDFTPADANAGGAAGGGGGP